MALFGFVSAAGRRAVATVGLAAVFGLASAQAQEPAAPAQAQAPAQPAQQEDLFKFSTGAGYFQFLVNPAQAADFESVWTAIFTKLAASEKPELKEIGTSLKMYKADPQPGGNPQVTYLFVADPAPATQSFSISPFLLFESGLFERPEAEQLFAKISASVAGFGSQAMTKLH